MSHDKELTLGGFLRQAREQRGIAIEQVASATKVGVKTLHALEADCYADLPAKPFIRGFVTAYCRFLGLSHSEVLADFEDYLEVKLKERPNRSSGHSGYAFERKDGEQDSRLTLLLAIFGFILLGGVAVVFLKPSLRHHRRSHIEQLQALNATKNGALAEPIVLPSSSTPLSFSSPAIVYSVPHLVPEMPTASVAVPILSGSQKPFVAAPIVPHPILEKVIQPSSVPVAVTAPAPAPAPAASQSPGHTDSNPADPLDSGVILRPEEIHHKLVFKVKAEVWVRYQVDDRPMRRFVIHEGRTLVLRAAKKIRVQISNPNAVHTYYNRNVIRWNVKTLGTVNDASPSGLGNHGLVIMDEGLKRGESAFAGEPSLPETSDPILSSPSPTPSAMGPS